MGDFSLSRKETAFPLVKMGENPLNHCKVYARESGTRIDKSRLEWILQQKSW